jgi:hypothetical protein
MTQITLAQIEQLFDKLGADGQIRFMDHLARRMECADGIDTEACAHEYADTQLSWNASDGARDVVVEGVLYPSVSRDGFRPVMDRAEAVAISVARQIEAVQTWKAAA